ncbi:MAG: hypothetical protein QM610_01530 [Chitinophagaceae bacterium]
MGIAPHSEFNQFVYKHMKAVDQIDVQVIDFPVINDLAGLSDHRNYSKFGYKALMINDTSFIR